MACVICSPNQCDYQGDTINGAVIWHLLELRRRVARNQRLARVLAGAVEEITIETRVVAADESPAALIFAALDQGFNDAASLSRVTRIKRGHQQGELDYLLSLMVASATVRLVQDDVDYMPTTHPSGQGTNGGGKKRVLYFRR